MKRDADAKPVPSEEVTNLKQEVGQLEKEKNELQIKVTELTQQFEAEKERRKKAEATSDALSAEMEKLLPRTMDFPHFFCKKTFILMKVSSDNSDYDMEEMKKHIQERGGRVVEDTKLIPKFDEEYLISDENSREYAYLYALARDMPCLSYKWVQECVKTGRFLPFDDYKLARGECPYDAELPPSACNLKNMLMGDYVMVHGDADFKAKWSPIVELLAGEVVSDETVRIVRRDASGNLILPSDFTILLTDGHFPSDVAGEIERESLNVDIVVVKWLIESIIRGENLAFNVDNFHPTYY